MTDGWKLSPERLVGESGDSLKKTNFEFGLGGGGRCTGLSTSSSISFKSSSDATLVSLKKLLYEDSRVLSPKVIQLVRLSSRGYREVDLIGSSAPSAPSSRLFTSTTLALAGASAVAQALKVSQKHETGQDDLLECCRLPHLANLNFREAIFPLACWEAYFEIKHMEGTLICRRSIDCLDYSPMSRHSLQKSPAPAW